MRDGHALSAAFHWFNGQEAYPTILSERIMDTLSTTVNSLFAHLSMTLENSEFVAR